MLKYIKIRNDLIQDIFFLIIALHEINRGNCKPPYTFVSTILLKGARYFKNVEIPLWQGLE
jgi:hypothetical protein